MTENAPRRRAPGMSPEQRREMIVQTALPLVAEHGTAVTTAQIARAAGIGEATIFRVFADKDELLDACVAAALRTEHVVAEVAEIPMDQPLAGRLAEVAAALDAYLARMGAVIGALHSTGRQGRGAHGGGRAADAGLDRDTAQRQLVEAVAELFQPERSELRLEPEAIASIFLGMLFTRTRRKEDGPALDDFLEVFLHGALTA
ncbi:TetR/AcrR family transcriptional regulator [Actinokineospora enzanensis]|uniref:TetR/AcrR family transcriptional regulator n=1 Tax=Actinokineospora enzanensis TaxID=155975 RepID=UPI0004766A27|nr:TetR/AcrR family transcriptional regulator [Actinokineospora enzanensis]